MTQGQHQYRHTPNHVLATHLNFSGSSYCGSLSLVSPAAVVGDLFATHPNLVTSGSSYCGSLPLASSAAVLEVFPSCSYSTRKDNHEQQCGHRTHQCRKETPTEKSVRRIHAYIHRFYSVCARVRLRRNQGYEHDTCTPFIPM